MGPRCGPHRISRENAMTAPVRYFVLLILVALAGRGTAAAAPCAHCVDYTPGYIVLPAATADNQGLLLAAGMLADAMGELYATAPAIISDRDFTMPHDGRGVVIVGAANKLVKDYDLGVYMEKRALRPESHGITTVDIPGGSPALLVYGADIRGEMFGLAYLAERLRLAPRRVLGVKELREPHFPIRIMSGDPVETAVRFGYNTVFTPHSHNNVVLLEDYDKDMFFQHDKQRGYLMERRAQFADALARQQALNIDSISSGDEFEFHKAVLKRPWAAELLRGGAESWLCFCNPRLWDLYAAKYREILGGFKDLDYIMLRLGENYAGGDYFGNVPATKEFWKHCPACMGDGYADRIATLINRTQKIVSGDHKRMYIHRTWDTNSDTFHTSPDMYREILSKVQSKENLYLSVKYTKTDFWMYNEFNETIGQDGAPQIVEFQCAREYEGKGAFPNYIGAHAAGGYRHAAAGGAAGAWNWHHGGGWDGPYPKTDLWNQANIYTAAHLAWNPALDPGDLAREWGALTFGAEDAEKIAKLLAMSTEAVRKLIYFEAYAQAKGDPWMPNENWVRDDVIKGSGPLRKIYTAASASVDHMVREKEDAVLLIQDMLGIAKDLSAPAELRQSAVQSLEYELALARVLRSYAAAYLYYCRWKETGAETDRAKAFAYANQWERDWDTYTRAIPGLKWSASLYRDDGMVETIREVLADLQPRR